MLLAISLIIEACQLTFYILDRKSVVNGSPRFQDAGITLI